MIQFSTVSGIKDFFKSKENHIKSIGFVPTMGALHKGHLSLVRSSLLQNDITVVSIFVNPIQFNNKEDLIKYPRTLNDDFTKLKSVGCDVVFTPDYKEIYPDGITDSFDFGDIEKVMEGEHRPGHFNGVAIVVKRLFEIVNPNRAYFGEKDFQQLLIIKVLVKKENLPIEIVPVKIVRESHGLAMSSRNELLSSKARIDAGLIFKVLSQVKRLFFEMAIPKIKKYVKKQFEENSDFTLEYFEIAESNTLQRIVENKFDKDIRAFIVVRIENVRLIDNISLT